jgi:transcriptional regulator with XRE-family HTH domain
MKAQELLDALARKLETTSQTQLASVLGITIQTLANWKNRNEELSPLQVAAALAKSRHAAVQRAQLETIRPLVEFFRISLCISKGGASWLVLDASQSLYTEGLKQALDDSRGLYIFYDSRGKALYVGKAKEQTIWQEMNKAFNRDRGEVQSIKLVQHPERNQEFKTGYEKLRQPQERVLELYDLATYFSAYSVDPAMIDDLEALMVRGFANDLLNVKMETFAHARE